MKRSVMFTNETAVSEPEPRRDRRERRAAPAAVPAVMAKLTDPAWVVRTLWARKGLILLCAVLGLVLAALASLLLPP